MHSNYLRSVWISYSGKNSEFVKQLTRDVKEKYSNIKPEVPEYVRFRLMTYLRYPDTSEPIKTSEDNQLDTENGLFFHLGISDNILDLVESIALNLRRVIVISKDYLQSDYCLLELCACMCAPKSLPIFFIYLDSLTLDRLIEYKFQSGEQGIVEKLTNICFSDGFKSLFSYFIDKDRGEAFSIIDKNIKGLVNQFYVKKRSGESFKDIVPTVSSHLDRYVRDQSVDFHAISMHQEYLVNIFEKWLENDSSKEWVKSFSRFKKENINGPRPKELIYLAKHIQEKFISSKDKKRDVSARLSIYQYCGLLSLKLIDPVWATEMRMSTLRSSPIRLSINPSDPTQNSDFSYLLAAHNITHEELKINSEISKDWYPPIKGRLRIDDLVEAREQSNNLVQEVMCELICMAFNCDRSAAIEKQKLSDWRGDLRAKLEGHFEDKYGVFSGVKFYIGRANNGSLTADKIVSAVNKVLEELNKDVTYIDERIEIGIVVCNVRDDGYMVQFVDGDYPKKLIDNIKTLMGNFYG